MTATTDVVRKESEGEGEQYPDILRMIGWDHMSDQQKFNTIEEARNMLMTKPKTLLDANLKLKKRVEAMHNTAIQSRRKADILQGQARSQENTARNLMNHLNEQEARIVQLSRAALILNAVQNNNAP